ncbi:MAG: hypothetical protein GX810_02220 [Clostridiales bacterium]|nr:hypothetical protein [Clostridiales bacterium]
MGIRNADYDEKRLIDRGKAFRTGFLAAMATIVQVNAGADLLGITVEPFAAFQLQLWIPLSACLIDQVRRNAFDEVNTNVGKLFFLFWGIAGLIAIGKTIVRLAHGSEVLLTTATIGEPFGRLVMGIGMLVTSIVYFVKLRQDARVYQPE